MCRTQSGACWTQPRPRMAPSGCVAHSQGGIRYTQERAGYTQGCVWTHPFPRIAPPVGCVGAQVRLPANVAHIRQSRPDVYGLAFEVQVLNTIDTVPSSLGSGEWDCLDQHLVLTFSQNNRKCKVFPFFLAAVCSKSSSLNHVAGRAGSPVPFGTIFNVRASTLQKCAAVPSRARVSGS